MPAVLKPLADAVDKMDTSLFALLLKSAALVRLFRKRGQSSPLPHPRRCLLGNSCFTARPRLAPCRHLPWHRSTCKCGTMTSTPARSPRRSTSMAWQKTPPISCRPAFTWSRRPAPAAASVCIPATPHLLRPSRPTARPPAVPCPHPKKQQSPIKPRQLNARTCPNLPATQARRSLRAPCRRSGLAQSTPGWSAQ